VIGRHVKPGPLSINQVKIRLRRPVLPAHFAGPTEISDTSFRSYFPAVFDVALEKGCLQSSRIAVCALETINNSTVLAERRAVSGKPKQKTYNDSYASWPVHRTSLALTPTAMENPTSSQFPSRCIASHSLRSSKSRAARLYPDSADPRSPYSALMAWPLCPTNT
jgi:hypothetical protein